MAPRPWKIVAELFYRALPRRREILRPSHAELRTLAAFFASGERTDFGDEPVEPWSLLLGSVDDRPVAWRMPDIEPMNIVIDGHEYARVSRPGVLDPISWGALVGPEGDVRGFDIHALDLPTALALQSGLLRNGGVEYESRDGNIDYVLIRPRNEGDLDYLTVEGFPLGVYQDTRGDCLFWLGCLDIWLGSASRLGFDTLDPKSAKCSIRIVPYQHNDP